MNKRFEHFALKSRKFIQKQKTDVKRRLKSRAHGGDDHGKDDPVTDSIFLVIPAFAGDLGDRPLPQGVAAWHSPAVNVIAPNIDPDTPLEILQNKIAPELMAGQNYIFETWVLNRGDMVAPAVNVEFFKRLPGFGATVENSEFLGAASISIDRNSQARATLPYTAAAEDAGHWCLHARATAFNPPDVPADWSSLSAQQHRHVGQQNVTVVQADSSMSMLISAPNTGQGKSKKMRIQVVAEGAPKHIGRDKCLVEGLSLVKGLGSAIFKLDADFQFQKSSRISNSWDMTLNKGETYPVSLQLPAHVRGDSSLRVYSVKAYDMQSVDTPELIDGVTLLIKR